MIQVSYKNDIYPYNIRVLLGADEHAAYLMGWMDDKVCDAYHKFKKEEEK